MNTVLVQTSCTQGALPTNRRSTAMTNIIESISSWTPVDPSDRLEQLKNRAQSLRPARLVLTDKPSPADLYVYLKTRFGPPNGIHMMLRNPSSDNMFHWHYTIQVVDGIVLEIVQSHLTTEIIIEGITPPTSTEWDQLIIAIQDDFKEYGPGMSKVRRQLEHWHLFINPYKRLFDVLDKCRTDLISLDIDCATVPPTPRTPEELRRFTDMLQNEGERFEDALRLGVTIRMLAPVLGEAFLNLLIFLFAKDDIKSDQRLYQDTIRRSIDIRIKSLHIYCNGFARPVDTESMSFLEFRTLMKGRNDFLHGNVDPTKLKYDTVYFDYRTVPVFERQASFGELALGHRLIHVEPQRALKDLDTVSRFVGLVVDSLEPNHQELVAAVVRPTSLGWRPKDGKVGVLFPEHIPHLVLGSS